MTERAAWERSLRVSAHLGDTLTVGQIFDGEPGGGRVEPMTAESYRALLDGWDDD